MDLLDTICQLSDDSQKMEAYKVGEKAFMFRMITILIKELETLKPGIQRKMLAELEKYATEVQGLPSLVNDQSSLKLVQGMNLAIEAYLEHVQKELSE